MSHFIDLGLVHDHDRNRDYYWFTMDRKSASSSADFYGLVDEVFAWCQEQCNPQYDEWAGGMAELTWEYLPVGNGFGFQKARDAVAFKLRWC